MLFNAQTAFPPILITTHTERQIKTTRVLNNHRAPQVQSTDIKNAFLILLKEQRFPIHNPSADGVGVKLTFLNNPGSKLKHNFRK